MLLALPDVGFLLPAEAKEWGYLVFLGVCGFIMQFLLAAGLAYEKSSRATNITYTQMLFALSFDRFFFGHTPDWMSLAGSTLILGSAIYIALIANVGKTGAGKEAADDDDDDDEAGLELERREEGLEAQEGLLGGARGGSGDVESGEDHDRIALGRGEIEMEGLR
ncbi:hypothetical protein LTR53_017750 [Teratosphaeriaceae sp. CCFEE 6253]|nr:hypothetical protein LTR53_017750 [Teratosphaeriaceae sp. CCFEE 6253]